MARAKTILELRQQVKAKDKFAAAGKPDDEATKLIAENYQTTDDSARAFVAWLKGGPASDAQESKPRGSVLESWHRQGDTKKGEERLLSDDESAKARGAKAKPKKK